ncbi:MAG: hypothetical protein U5R31_16930 [Acidimicrobiia bacterium]|nr:hypothetical protein [Acidimicrobiia bacterium]
MDEALARDQANYAVKASDIIQARRVKFAHLLSRHLRAAGFRPLLAEVSDEGEDKELPALLHLTLVFEGGEQRPSKEEIRSCVERPPLSKFGLELIPRVDLDSNVDAPERRQGTL